MLLLIVQCGRARNVIYRLYPILLQLTSRSVLQTLTVNENYPQQWRSRGLSIHSVLSPTPRRMFDETHWTSTYKIKRLTLDYRLPFFLKFLWGEWHLLIDSENLIISQNVQGALLAYVIYTSTKDCQSEARVSWLQTVAN